MDDKEKKMLLTGMVGILWFLAVLLAYAYTHKPFTPEQVFVLAKIFWQLLVSAMIISLGGGIGARIFPREKGLSSLALLIIQSALGLGVLSLFILLMGYTIGFSTLYFAILLLILGIFFRRYIWRWWQLWAALGDIWGESKKFDKVLAVGIGFILATMLAKSLAPPLKFDALVYHLSLPKIYLLEGRINYVPELMFWGMPQLAEILYTFAMALAGVESAVVLGWAFGALTLTGLLGYLAERFSPRAAWVALASLLAGGTLSASLSWAYIGWASMFYGISFFILLDLWILRREKKYLWLAAILLGFAVGTKYTAAILAGAALPVIFLANRGRGVKFALRDVLTLAGIALLVFSPWLIKNFLATGNPIYPMLFPSGAMDAYRLHLYQGDAAWGSWIDFVLLPWQATIWGVEGKVGYSAEIGSLLLALSAFSWLGWKKRSDAQKESLRTIFLMVVTGFLIWAFAGRTSRLLVQSRLYFSLFPLWAILAGVGFESFSKIRVAGVRFGRIASALVLLAFGFNIFVTGVNFIRLRVTETLIGAQTRADYSERVLGAYETAMSALEELPADSQIIMLWETRGLACIQHCEPDETIDRWYADLRIYGSSESVLDAWRAAGYTHLLYNEHGANFIYEHDAAYSAADWFALEEFLAELVLLERFDSSYQLFSLE